MFCSQARLLNFEPVQRLHFFHIFIRDVGDIGIWFENLCGMWGILKAGWGIKCDILFWIIIEGFHVSGGITVRKSKDRISLETQERAWRHLIRHEKRWRHWWNVLLSGNSAHISSSVTKQGYTLSNFEWKASKSMWNERSLLCFSSLESRVGVSLHLKELEIVMHSSRPAPTLRLNMLDQHKHKNTLNMVVYR